jgi:hypothetical protein
MKNTIDYGHKDENILANLGELVVPMKKLCEPSLPGLTPSELWTEPRDHFEVTA